MDFTFRQNVYADAHHRYEQRYGQPHMGRGSCLYWTLTELGILNFLGYHALLQAIASMSWPILPPQLWEAAVGMRSSLAPREATYSCGVFASAGISL